MFVNLIQAIFVAIESALYNPSIDTAVRRQKQGRFSYHPCVANKPPKLLLA